MYFNDSAQCRTPTPLIISFHGGGFISHGLADWYPDNIKLCTSGNVNDLTSILPESKLIENRFAYATANYSIVDGISSKTVINSLRDCMVFVRYMRGHASEYNIDPNKIILLGGSAGASAALWVGLQDPSIKGIIGVAPQATLNINAWQDQVFTPWDRGAYCFYSMPVTISLSNQNTPGGNYKKALYGSDDPNYIAAYSQNYNLNLQSLITAKSPELYIMSDVAYNQPPPKGIPLIHDFCHVYTLKKQANNVGLKCQYFTNANWGFTENLIQFCQRKFK